MATVVFVHAHPDDEASSTGGSIVRAAAEGHRVVVVTCTDGAHGESPDDLAAGETLIDRRRTETARSMAVLGVARHVWLGYTDSGMTGWEQNGAAGSFWSADLDEAGGRLAGILREEAADVVVTYDWHGGYGHPDHVQTHRVAHRAAELAGTRQVFEVTMNRDAMRAMMATFRTAVESGAVEGPDDGEGWDVDGPADDGNPIGTPEAEIQLAVDVAPYLAQKREALGQHVSQTSDVGMMLAMPEDVFATMFGTEWYLVPGAPASGMRAGWLFDELVPATLPDHND